MRRVCFHLFLLVMSASVVEAAYIPVRYPLPSPRTTFEVRIPLLWEEMVIRETYDTNFLHHLKAGTMSPLDRERFYFAYSDEGYSTRFILPGRRHYVFKARTATVCLPLAVLSVLGLIGVFGFVHDLEKYRRKLKATLNSDDADEK